MKAILFFVLFLGLTLQNDELAEVINCYNNNNYRLIKLISVIH